MKIDLNKNNPKDWYFASQRQRVSPFPNYMSMETVMTDMEKHVGYNVSDILYFTVGNVITIFTKMADREKIGHGLTRDIKNNINIVSRLVKEQHTHGRKLVKFACLANKEVKGKVSNKQLYNLYKQFEKYYKEVYSRYGWIWMVEDYYMAEMLRLVEGKLANKKEAVDITNHLTAEPSAMVALMERKALLDLGLNITRNQAWRELVVKHNYDEVSRQPELRRLIIKHVNKYFWVTRDYEDPIIDANKVVERLAGYFASDIKTEHDNLIKELKENENKRKKYLKELRFTAEEKQWLEAMREMAYLKELRKRYVSESLHYFDDILKEIGKRLLLSLRQVRFMRTSDVWRALIKGEDLTDELNERIKISLWTFKKGVAVPITGALAQKLYDKFCQVKKDSTEFAGMPVSSGVAKGPIKIVMDPSECDRVEKGDIILSIQVVPSFSTAIMKAAGLICDGGHGVTTHPATLAREAGIPCVIQTRFAKEVLKDGDMVEVDGYKGIVRKI